MNKEFDYLEAQRTLADLEKKKQCLSEEQRLALLNKTIVALKKLIMLEEVSVFLVGSIVSPGKFHQNSDVDIVLKNFRGDRFDLWSELERTINHNVEIILYENCTFGDYVDQYGFKVM